MLLAQPRPFSWIRTRRLAIGGFPKNWDWLLQSGFNKIFSCCSYDEGNWNPPSHWSAMRLTLPDHRKQFELKPSLLSSALDCLEEMVSPTLEEGALYLHCLAGRERSPLLAVGLLCRIEDIDFFDALYEVRRLHQQTKPIVEHLIVLENLIKHGQRY